MLNWLKSTIQTKKKGKKSNKILKASFFIHKLEI